MTYEITSECICCGLCRSECPVEIISEGPEIYVIDPVRCTGCGACLAVCPVGAIREVE
jgi:ferredoxin